jgi:hypothetical protein
VGLWQLLCNSEVFQEKYHCHQLSSTRCLRKRNTLDHNLYCHYQYSYSSNFI